MQGGNSEKTLGGPKVKNVDLFGQGGKYGPFCGQLLADGANASAEGTKLFWGVRGHAPQNFFKN